MLELLRGANVAGVECQSQRHHEEVGRNDQWEDPEQPRDPFAQVEHQRDQHGADDPERGEQEVRCAEHEIREPRLARPDLAAGKNSGCLSTGIGYDQIEKPAGRGSVETNERDDAQFLRDHDHHDERRHGHRQPRDPEAPPQAPAPT